MIRFYLSFCKRWGPRRLTFSAWAWAVFTETGDSYWRDRFDGALLFWRGERDHCKSQFQRESAATKDRP